MIFLSSAFRWFWVYFWWCLVTSFTGSPRFTSSSPLTSEFILSSMVKFSTDEWRQPRRLRQSLRTFSLMKGSHILFSVYSFFCWQVHWENYKSWLTGLVEAGMSFPDWFQEKHKSPLGYSVFKRLYPPWVRRKRLEVVSLTLCLFYFATFFLFDFLLLTISGVCLSLLWQHFRDVEVFTKVCHWRA